MIGRKAVTATNEPDALDSCGLFVGCLLVIAFVLGAGVWSMFVQVVK